LFAHDYIANWRGNGSFSQISGDINRYVCVYAFLLLWNPRVNYDRPIEGTPANAILDSRYAFRVPRDTQISAGKSRLPRSVQLREGRKKLAISSVKCERKIVVPL